MGQGGKSQELRQMKVTIMNQDVDSFLKESKGHISRMGLYTEPSAW